MWFHKVEFFSSVIYFKGVFNGHPFIIFCFIFCFSFICCCSLLRCRGPSHLCAHSSHDLPQGSLLNLNFHFHVWPCWNPYRGGLYVCCGSQTMLKSTLWFIGLSNASIGYTIYFGHSIHSESKTREIGLNITAEEMNILPLRNTVHNIPTLLCWHWSCVLL